MSDITINAITGVGSAAAARVASALTSRTSMSEAAASAKASVGAASTTQAAGSTITSNDFLTLLVSELKNQDPTQPTDPNAYIQQLVGVNSLQQLIQINQGLSSIESPVKTTTGATSASTAAAV